MNTLTAANINILKNKVQLIEASNVKNLKNLKKNLVPYEERVIDKSGNIIKY